MVASRSLSGALVAASVVTSSAAGASFLPGRRNGRVPLYAHRTGVGAPRARASCIPDLRGGSFEDASDVVAASVEGGSGGVSERSTNNNASGSAAKAKGGEGREEEPWGEEIRRTREFYSTPRISDQSDKILITGAASAAAAAAAVSGGDDDGEVASEDERAFGSAQTSSYVGAEIRSDELDREVVAGSRHDVVNVNVEEGDDEVDAAMRQSLGEVVDTASDLDDVSDGADESESSSTRDAPSGQDDILSGSTETGDDDEISGHDGSIESKSDNGIAVEKEVFGELDNVDETEGTDDNADAPADEGTKVVEEEAPAAAQVDDSVESAFSNVNDGESTVPATDEEVRLDEDYLDGSHIAEDPPTSNVKVKEEDLLLPHGFERAPRATATNRLVEDGLNRLRRRDGDAPSVPYVVTRAMRRVLVDDLGYDPEEVEAMRPDVAVVIVAEGLRRPDLESLPSRFYDYVEPSAAVEETGDDKSFKEKVSVLVQRLRRRASSVSLLQKHPEATAMVAASLGIAMSLLLGSSRGDKRGKQYGIAPAASEFHSAASRLPSSIEVPSDANGELSDIEDDFDRQADGKSSAPTLRPGDLDKTWLDKLISLVSKPFGA